jgi:RNA-splicing ligase RtcB
MIDAVYLLLHRVLPQRPRRGMAGYRRILCRLVTLPLRRRRGAVSPTRVSGSARDYYPAVQTAASHNAAKRERSAEDVLAALRAKGSPSPSVAPPTSQRRRAAHKPIEDVIRDSADLVEPMYKLKPLGVMKG